MSEDGTGGGWCTIESDPGITSCLKAGPVALLTPISLSFLITLSKASLRN